MRGVMSMIFWILPWQYSLFSKRWARAAAGQDSPVEVGNVDVAERRSALRITPDQVALAQGGRSHLHEALGQHMQQEPTQQLLAAERHHLALHRLPWALSVLPEGLLLALAALDLKRLEHGFQLGLIPAL